MSKKFISVIQNGCFILNSRIYWLLPCKTHKGKEQSKSQQPVPQHGIFMRLLLIELVYFRVAEYVRCFWLHPVMVSFIHSHTMYENSKHKQTNSGRECRFPPLSAIGYYLILLLKISILHALHAKQLTFNSLEAVITNGRTAVGTNSYCFYRTMYVTFRFLFLCCFGQPKHIVSHTVWHIFLRSKRRPIFRASPFFLLVTTGYLIVPMLTFSLLI